MTLQEFENLKNPEMGINTECVKCHAPVLYLINSGKTYIECKHCGHKEPLTEDQIETCSRLNYIEKVLLPNQETKNK